VKDLKVGVYPFGCKVNQYDLAGIVAFLKAAGVNVVYQESGDINIVAGCVVTSNAEKEGVRLIKKLSRAGLKVLLMGCLAVHRGKELKEKGFVEEFFGTTPAELQRLKNYLAARLGLPHWQRDTLVELPEHSRANSRRLLLCLQFLSFKIYEVEYLECRGERCNGRGVGPCQRGL